MTGKRSKNGALFGIVFLILILPIYAILSFVVKLDFVVYALFSAVIGLAGFVGIEMLGIDTKRFFERFIIGIGISVIFTIMMKYAMGLSLLPMDIIFSSEVLSNLPMGIISMMFLSFLVLVILNPLTEEGFFNAFLTKEWLSKINMRRNFWAGIFLIMAIASIFAIGHTTSYMSQIEEGKVAYTLEQSLFIAFVFRFLASTLALATREITVAWGFHTGVNFLAWWSMWFGF